MFGLVGLTRRGLRFGTRIEEREKRKQLERITSNVGDYEAVKLEQHRTRVHETQMDRLEAEKQRHEQATAKAMANSLKLNTEDVPAEALLKILDQDDDDVEPDGE